MSGLWRNVDGAGHGKFNVAYWDGRAVGKPYIVLTAGDEAAPAALDAYADECEARGYSAEYVADVRREAARFRAWREQHGDSGRPDEPPSPSAVAAMRAQQS